MSEHENKHLSSAIQSTFEAIKTKLNNLLSQVNAHEDRTDNPHSVTKAQVGLGTLPNAKSDSRTLNSTTTLATAKAVYDHANSADHDGRYYTQDQLNTALALKSDIADIVDDLVSTHSNRALSANQGKILKDAVDSINALLQSDTTTLDELQEIVDFIKVNRDTLDSLSISSIAGLQVALDSKVDKIAGMGLSTNDFTNALLTKLNGIAAGAQVNVPTNLSATRDADSYDIANDNGSGFNLQLADASAVGLMSSAMFTKLGGIQAGAQVNLPTTASRTSAATGTVLQAKAMNDHRISGDHDGRYYLQSQLDAWLAEKVDKVTGLGLSANDFTDALLTKLNGIAAGAQVNVATNLSISGSGDARTITSSTGTNAALPLASSTTAGLMNRADHDKLAGIAAGAQVNVGTNLGRSLATTSITLTSSTGSNTNLPEASASYAGVMSNSDKAKLDTIASGAQVNVGTNLNFTGTGNTRTLTSSTGSNTSVPVATASNAGLMATGDKSKLDGIQAGAEVNTPLTSSRTSASTAYALTAKAMNDHRVSGDHDGRYVNLSGDSTIAGVITAQDFVYSSDERLKKDIAGLGPVTDRLTMLGRLAKRYRLKADEHGHLRMGWLAHEAAQVFPEILREDEHGYLGLSEGDLISVLTKGFAEKTQEVDDLRATVVDLQEKVELLMKAYR